MNLKSITELQGSKAKQLIRGHTTEGIGKTCIDVNTM
jgi:hypothetical protein